ncbi:bacterial sec-independent translocation protein mttA/Hcf106 [Actinidia rufa]|uniref:Bacterial sec-independent translocation protein mttA/Hcf106 n=1 Tax=Actinidia rufa TaxID=165716 RepID=A0A7J0G6N3_9ERIC|nr:bacterial sec-independent translocation protein mttA/Hcf106 [Actinidia rufa]
MYSSTGSRPILAFERFKASGYVNLTTLCEERKRKIYASLFGVGAPEALVIGVVALLVFGPKGLAEKQFKRNDYFPSASSGVLIMDNMLLGIWGKLCVHFSPRSKSFRTFQGNSKSTLEREIGLDEIQSSTQNTYSSTKTSTTSSPSSIASPEASQTVADPSE